MQPAHKATSAMWLMKTEGARHVRQVERCLAEDFHLMDKLVLGWVNRPHNSDTLVVDLSSSHICSSATQEKYITAAQHEEGAVDIIG